MADLNQLYDALLKADAAGDVEGAKTLAQYIQQVQGLGAPPTPQAPKEDGFFDMAGRAVVRGAKQTGSLLGDVLPALVRPLVLRTMPLARWQKPKKPRKRLKPNTVLGTKSYPTLKG
jgi:hypothetical protein